MAVPEELSFSSEFPEFLRRSLVLASPFFLAPGVLFMYRLSPLPLADPLSKRVAFGRPRMRVGPPTRASLDGATPRRPFPRGLVNLLGNGAWACNR